MRSRSTPIVRTGGKCSDRAGRDRPDPGRLDSGRFDAGAAQPAPEVALDEVEGLARGDRPEAEQLPTPSTRGVAGDQLGVLRS